MFKRVFFNLLLILEISLALNAQLFPSRSYSTLDGMPSNSVFDITQNSDGVMWFLTSKGITLYDGQKWDTFTEVDLPNSQFSYLKKAEDGSIWAAGQNSTELVVFRWVDDSWSQISLPAKLSSTKGIFNFEVNSQGDNFKIWLLSDGILFHYDSSDDGWQNQRIEYVVNSLHWIEDRLFICSEEGLFHLEGDEIKEHELNGDLPNEDILTVLRREENLFILGFNWIALQRKGSLTLREDIGLISKKQLGKFNLLLDHQNRVFYSSDSPIQMWDYDNQEIRKISTKSTIRNANRVFIDRENIIWIGDHRGLFKLNHLRFRNYNHETGLLDEEVSAIFQTLSGSVLLANTRGFNVLNNGMIVDQYNIPVDPNEECRILDIEQGEDGRIYLACSYSGLWSFHNGSLKQISKGLFTSVERLGNAVIATTVDQQFKVHGTSLELQSTIRNIRNLIGVDKNTLVAATDKGAYVITNSSNDFYESRLLGINNIFNAAKWNNHVLLGTSGGLARIEGDSITTMEIPIRDFSVYSMLVDKNDALWLGTDDGLVKWNGQEYQQYNKGNGLVGNEANRNALIQDKRGNIWIGTDLGVSLYNENEDVSLNSSERPAILEFTDGKGSLLDPNQVHQVDYADNNIYVYFRTTSFIDEEKLQYRYRLDGIDDRWYQIGNTNSSARYTSLPPGNYKFLVMSKVDQGAWSAPEIIFFEIIKPFYWEVWFIVIAGIVMLLVLYFVYRLRVIYLLKYQQKLKNIVSERTKEIVELNENLERKVQDRTKELEDRNKRLREYTFLNAHILRAPLTRIQSITSILDKQKNKDMDDKMYSILKKSVEDLDEVIYDINNSLNDPDFPEEKTGKNK